jgi:hypothetical protein
MKDYRGNIELGLPFGGRRREADLRDAIRSSSRRSCAPSRGAILSPLNALGRVFLRDGKNRADRCRCDPVRRPGAMSSTTRDGHGRFRSPESWRHIPSSEHAVMVSSRRRTSHGFETRRRCTQLVDATGRGAAARRAPRPHHGCASPAPGSGGRAEASRHSWRAYPWPSKGRCTRLARDSRRPLPPPPSSSSITAEPERVSAETPALPRPDDHARRGRRAPVSSSTSASRGLASPGRRTLHERLHGEEGDHAERRSRSHARKRVCSCASLIPGYPRELFRTRSNPQRSVRCTRGSRSSETSCRSSRRCTRPAASSAYVVSQGGSSPRCVTHRRRAASSHGPAARDMARRRAARSSTAASPVTGSSPPGT